MSATTATAVIDCLVHPICSDRALRRYLVSPWHKYTIPQAAHYSYPPPVGEFRSDIKLELEEDDITLENGREMSPPTRVITPA